MIISIIPTTQRPPVEVLVYPLPGGGELACIRHRLLPAYNPQPYWENWAAALMVAGSGSYHEDTGQRHVLRPGHIIQHLPGRWHRVQRDDTEACLEYAIRADTITTQRLEALDIIDQRPVLRCQTSHTAAARAFDRCWATLAAPDTSPSATIHAVHSLILHWFGTAKEGGHSDEVDLASQARRLATDTAAILSLWQVAANMDLSEVQFRRRFRARYGMGPGQWRDRHRLATTARLLAQDGLAVQTVSELCGYSEPAAFSRAFKRHHGHPPAQHRQEGGAQGPLNRRIFLCALRPSQLAETTLWATVRHDVSQPRPHYHHHRSYTVRRDRHCRRYADRL